MIKNYCRNPDGEPSIWCYTVDKKSRWEHCVPLGDANSSKSPKVPGSYGAFKKISMESNDDMQMKLVGFKDEIEK